MEHIKHILFDLGNVIIDLDFARVNAAFRELTGDRFDELASSDTTRHIFEDYEVGAITEATFVERVQQLAGDAIAPEHILNAWNAMLVGVPPHRFEMLLRLAKHYRLFLLSNTNVTHLEWVYRDLAETHGITDFDERFFERSYYSHLIQLRKPHPEVYEFVLADAGIAASDTLFIDDNADNIQGAQSIGLNTILHNSGKDIEEVLQSVGIIR